MVFATQSLPNGTPKRRYMYPHVNHQPPMSNHIGEIGWGQCRSSSQKCSFFSSSSFHSIGVVASPKNSSMILLRSGICDLYSFFDFRFSLSSPTSSRLFSIQKHERRRNVNPAPHVLISIRFPFFVTPRQFVVAATAPI